MSLVGVRSAVDSSMTTMTCIDIDEEVDLADRDRSVVVNLRTLQSAECLFFV